MTSTQHTAGDGDRGFTPADLQNVRFTRASMLHPGYVDTEVDRLVSRAAEALSRLIAEKAQLRDQVRALQARLDGAPAQVAPSDQAVRILSTAQQTADNYVAEAEEFSRQMTSEARALYEEQVRQARENAGAILQAAQEAAAKITGGAASGGASRGTSGGADAGSRTVEELQEQVAYLKAFGQACRTQLRSYLEALLSDVETEWGHADPALLPQDPRRAPAQRTGSDGAAERSTTFAGNTAAEPPEPAPRDVVPATAGATASTARPTVPAG